ncbi:MAG TPA: hypothetical protein PKD94_08180 [Ignavibacteria bacterium]|nr:hypothetical protein [Ignavibacteria bacterium]
MILQGRILTLFFLCSIIFHPVSQTRAYLGSSSDSTESRTHEYIKLTIRNAPVLTLQFAVDYDYGVFELSANDNGDLNQEQFITGKNFGVRHGFGANVTAKFPLHKAGNLRLTSALMYNRFTSKFNKLFAEQKEQDFVKYDVYSISFGLEDNFNPGLKLRAFAGIGILGSIISGKAQITDDGGTNEYSINPAFRIGLNIYSGFEYLINKNFGLSFGLKFTHANLWLKESKISDSPGELELNDQKVSNGQLYSGYRQFAWGSFGIGINYYLGVNEKVYHYRKF